MEIKLISFFSCVIPTINFTLLFFIVKYIFLKQFIKLLIVKYTYWPTDRPTDQPTDRPTDRRTDGLTDWLAGCLAGWLTDWLKEPLTLEKDKEDQSKYYLSYPRPSVLNMKQKNRDINVVEQANTTKFSVLDAIVSPSRLK